MKNVCGFFEIVCLPLAIPKIKLNKLMQKPQVIWCTNALTTCLFAEKQNYESVNYSSVQTGSKQVGLSTCQESRFGS